MRSRALIVVGALAAVLVCGGWFLEAGLHGAARKRGSIGWALGRGGNGARVFTEVIQHVTQDYVDSVPAGQMYQKAIDGMLYELHDPHSVFLPPDRLRRLTESTTGLYVGLGIQIDIREGWITIIAPLPGSPAEHAGLQAGDRMVQIEGRSTRGWTQDEATAVLHGTAGTPVQLMIERPGVEAQFPVRVMRQEIHVRAVRHAAIVRPGVGYVDATVFSDSTARELRQAIDSLRGQGMRTLLLDLRNDPGGLLTQGVAVADLFLAPGQPVVTMRGRAAGTTREFVDQGPGQWSDLGLIVLVNGGSASASEIVAGALQDHDRALIVGTVSYGKGSAQTLFHLDDGALKLTTALWYTPSGRSISRRLVHPDDDGDEPSAPPVAADSAAPKAAYHTDAGRVVYGGGGITPDVIVSDTIAAARDLALQRALGPQLPRFRDALTSYALALKTEHAIPSPDVTIAPEMRAELWRRMRGAGVTMDRHVFDQLTPAVDRWLTAEIVRYDFGAEAAFRSALRTDPTVLTALGLAARATSARDLVLHPALSVDASTAVAGHGGDRSDGRTPIR